ncbi:glycosyltransferase family 2 protein [Tuwongella immobilis]|uniref:Glycosyltransferase 2-like domain-containing protein n=1 Tax=Tuwongella immobilis TaxID=692036 RepID=A0A6C2YRJ4_9BACT|nr:glycosyltransferase family 2 protein [Tuwongella immobilis]VIP03789.1 Glycosyl transferase family protein OS=Sporocytophaga myxococcoides GN=MYP_564 PE=4 SV=1: Glycos_transf_2 [Tuwongella immobilis]VTS04945.1 Glycosyl transferase family protein OS=Sporocytophaga myxococcoides GN=MYP_564 PE=4 SV=1: Glycos_transf_2 [Tuwongella immobilis]
MSRTLSIIVPCYNEADNLPTLFTAFREAVGDRTDVEVVLVNNGSTDRSASVFTEQLTLPGHVSFRVVKVAHNQGYGFGILSGLRAAKGEFLAWTHADLQTDPRDVLTGFDRMRELPEPERTFLRGRRIGRPLFDRIFTVGMGWLASMALGSRLVDVNAQPKCFHRSFFETWSDAPHDFSLDLYALHQANLAKLAIVELPVHFGERKHGEAKGGGSLRGKIKLTRRTLSFILALRRKLKANRRLINKPPIVW